MAEEKNCQDLLEVERSSAIVSSTSALESKLFVCKKDGPFAESEAPQEKPNTFPVPKSQILGKLKDFLGVMSESNKKLMENAKENPENYDIEVLSGRESEVIEMDLMMGIADLHTPEAVAAAEREINGCPRKIIAAENFSGSEDEEDDHDDTEEDYSSNDDDRTEANTTAKNDDKPSSRARRIVRKTKSNEKRPKIVELS